MKSNDYDEETTKRAEGTAESFIRNNYQDIETVEIEKVYRGEMGGMRINGNVNASYGFSLGMDEDSFTVQSVGGKEGFPGLKEECRNKVCDYHSKECSRFEKDNSSFPCINHSLRRMFYEVE